MEDFGTMTWTDLADEEERHWNRPRCAMCGEDFGLTHILILPYNGEEEWFCDSCWGKMQEEDGDDED